MYDYFPIDYTWTAETTKICLPIILALIFFCLFWFVSLSEKIKQKYYDKYEYDTASLKHIVFTKYFGFVSMGIIPLVLCLIFIPDYTLADYGIALPVKTLGFTALWTIGLSIIVVPLIYNNAKKPSNFLQYPQIKAKNWNKSMLLQSLSGWTFYLTGYEILFRGVLLFPLVETIGLWPAIAVNVALYAGTHIPKGLKETVGAIPFGIVLCLLTVAAGNVWIAVIVHIAMAWTNNITAVKHNPDITYTS